MRSSSIVCVACVACIACVACRPGGGEDVAPAAARASAPRASLGASSAGGELTAPADSTPPALRAPLPHFDTDWCGEGLVGLDAETCYRVPPALDRRAMRLLVYLHGVVPPQVTSPQKEGFQRVVVRAGERAGAVVLVPRGLKGVGPAATRTWWAWPTSQPSYGKHLDAIVDRWKDAKAKLEAALGAPFDRTYLAGSSNGAYYVTLLALRGDLDDRAFHVDGFGAMSGGSRSGKNASALEGRPRHPFYVGFGSHDPASKRDAGPLVATLREARWPVRVAEHPLGHGAREVYLDEAFAFWDANAPPDANASP